MSRTHARSTSRSPATSGRPVQRAKGGASASIDQAFASLIEQMLEAVVSARPAVLREDANALHAMRVALRQLRVVVALFEPAIGAGEARRIVAASHWLSALLAPARDFDVLLAGLGAATPRRRHPEDLEGLASLRQRAYRGAIRGIRSARFQSFLQMLRSALRRARRAAASTARDAGRASLSALAGHDLERRRAKFLRAARRLEDLDADERHRVRIRGRKLRFAMEFVLPAFPGGKARARHRDAVGALQRLQHALGAMNDIAQRRAVAARQLRGASARERAALKRLLKARGPQHRRRMAREASEALRDFRSIKPFWE